MQRRVSELETDKATSDQRHAGHEARIAEQDKTIAGLGRIIAEAGKDMAGLKADLGRVPGALNELRESQRAGSQCGDRATVRRQRGGTTRVEETAA